MSNVYNVIPLETSLFYNISSSYCLIFDPIKQQQHIQAALDNNIQPIIIINNYYNELNKKEDVYIFNESFNNYPKISFFEEIVDYYKTININLIDRPSIDIDKISSFAKRPKKYEVILYCENEGLKTTIRQSLLSSNNNMHINIMSPTDNKNIKEIYEIFSEYEIAVIMDDMLLSKIALDLNLTTITNKPVYNSVLCNTVDEIIATVKKREIKTPVIPKHYDFENSIKSFVKNLT